MIRLPKVLVTVPNGKGWLHKHVSAATNRLLCDRRCVVTIMYPTWVPYEHNLNRCAKQVLDDGYDFWLNIDTDNPPTNNPLDLVCEDLDLVGCPTPVWHDGVHGDRPWYFNALDWDAVTSGWRPHEPCIGLQEVDAIGSGCFLAAGRIIAKLAPPWFMRRYDRWGIVTHGHDYLFCDKVRQAGFRIHAHYDYLSQHFCELDLLSVIRAFAAMQPQEVR